MLSKLKQLKQIAGGLMRHLGEEPSPSKWRGSVIALHDKKALYYRVPKVANSSLSAVCVDLLGFKLPDGAWKPGVFRGDQYDLLIDTDKRDKADIGSLEAGHYSTYWRFAFVRHPMDRLVSCFSEKIKKSPQEGSDKHFVEGVHFSLVDYGVFRAGMSFHDFAHAVAAIPDEEADRHFRSQWTFLVDDNDKLAMDFVGYFERIEQDVQIIAQHLGEEINLPHLLQSKHRPYTDYYTKALAELVYQRYRRDFELFEYAIPYDEINN